MRLALTAFFAEIATLINRCNIITGSEQVRRDRVPDFYVAAEGDQTKVMSTCGLVCQREKHNEALLHLLASPIGS